MSRKQVGLGYHWGLEDGFNAGWECGYETGYSAGRDDESSLGLAVAVGAALLGGAIGLVAGSLGRNKSDTYTCKRCGSDFTVPRGETPRGCPYCSQR